MAFTAVHYPTDKDQGHVPYWPENEELGVASENFFDQFVTFDSSDPTALSGSGNLLDDPPSPSLLLESLNERLANSSSSDQDTQSGQAQSESSATSVSLDILSFDCSEAAPSGQSKSVPAEFTTPLLADPILSGGSISDSELLCLEGISLKSPKLNATAPSSPPFENRGSPSPRKHNRVLDSIYNTFRRATHRAKPRKHHDSSVEASVETMMSDLFKKGQTSNETPLKLDLDDFADIKLEDMSGPVDSHGIPVSPPLTGRIPPDQHPSDVMDFINGRFDDPFCDGILAAPSVIPPTTRKHDANLSTPLDTPGLNDDPFYQHSMDHMDTNGPPFHPQHRQPKLRSTSSAEWPMEGILTNESDSNNMWSSSPPPGGYVPDSGEWWDTPNGHHRRNGIHMSMHNQQADLPYDYNAHGDLSGLMIHMPQPRAPQAAVLGAGDPLAMSSPGSAYYPPPRHHHRRHYSEQRRPRPRAPSAGARHYGTPLTSPRKPSSSSSAACYTLREEPPSPTPGPRQHRSASSGSGSLAVRKRRSWRGRQNDPGSAARSASSSCRPGGYEGLHGGGRRASSGGAGGGLSIEFCNYTPNDKKVLMNGVAPSGSSKTKARREREAQEHKRQMSEAYMHAIRAAGGDVDKLRQIESEWMF
ncbi:hypothetical protein F4804DRAFT_350040 [Jackrogersella minutella]|nr:hypothetical protein F4804DRAFT_350040 [Jackrogersella minutella]